jgi:ATP-dependent protease HslVU (ClpYQ) peptidase subunit
MTAIVAYRTPEATYVAADKRHNFDYGMYFDNAQKYWANNGIWIFCGGNASIGQAIKGLTFERNEEMSQAILYQEVLPKLRQAVEEAKVDKPDFVFLVIFDGLMWMINETFYACEIPSETFAIGTGGDYAEGYFKGTVFCLDQVIDPSRGLQLAIEETAKKFRNVSPTCDIIRIAHGE